MQVSLDGTERVHDRIRGRGSFLRAAEGIDRLKARGVPVQVSFTAQRENRRSLPALALFCRAHGVDKLWFDRVVIPAEEDTGHLSLSGEEFRQLVRTAPTAVPEAACSSCWRTARSCPAAACPM